MVSKVLREELEQLSEGVKRSGSDLGLRVSL
jgi:hypothetical protein